jgi:hypothetical protein
VFQKKTIFSNSNERVNSNNLIRVRKKHSFIRMGDDARKSSNHEIASFEIEYKKLFE